MVRYRKCFFESYWKLCKPHFDTSCDIDWATSFVEGNLDQHHSTVVEGYVNTRARGITDKHVGLLQHLPLTGFCLSRLPFVTPGVTKMMAGVRWPIDFLNLTHEQPTCCSRLATYLFHGNFTYIRRSARFISPFRSFLGKSHPRASSTGC